MMIKYKDLYKDIEPWLKEMIDKVDYINFKKCIAQYSGLNFDRVSDEVLVDYLITWARNKYRFYKMFNNELFLTQSIEYEEQGETSTRAMEDIQKDFPEYAMWIDKFKYVKKNKIKKSDLDYDVRDLVKRLFPEFNMEGSSITHFFKKCLNGSNEVVTAIGRCYENQVIKSNFTLSIDPVDMMLASENPYDWSSCYKLMTDGNDCSHADGCLASVLDDSTIITYVWNRSGDLTLYEKYQIKNVNYKQMRMWIAVAPNNTAIHFNKIYPGCTSYSADFQKKLRIICEDIVNKDTVWKQNTTWEICSCHRERYYGYEEFDVDNIYYDKTYFENNGARYSWTVYNEPIYCPCGCGEELPCSDDLDEMNYTGDGFCCENFYESHYCELIDDYCHNYEDCENCSAWCRANPVCELDNSETCECSDEAERNSCFDPYDNNVVLCGEHCEGCPLYKYHHPEVDEDELHDEQMISGNDD